MERAFSPRDVCGHDAWQIEGIWAKVCGGLALILTFSPEEKEQRRCVRAVRAAGARLRFRAVVVIPSRAFLAPPSGCVEIGGRFPGVSLPGRSTPGYSLPTLRVGGAGQPGGLPENSRRS
jgi:hypothetical protein